MQLNGSRDERTGGRPFFRAGTRLLIFAATFALLIGVLAGITLMMFNTASDSIQKALGTELEAISRSAASAISVPIERHADASEVGAMLRRVREAHKLEDIMLLSTTGLTLADPRGNPAGVPTSIFAATPAMIRQTVATGAPATEYIDMLGDQYRRQYFPVLQNGTITSVLCLAVHDPLPQSLQSLEWPLQFGLTVGGVTALLLAFVVLALLRFFDKSRQHLLRTARLTTTGLLAASIAHDVRNPLAIVLSAAEVVSGSRDLSPEAREMLETIVEEVRRADDQLDSFLDLSRDMPIRLAAEDVASLVEQTAEFVQRGGRHVTVTIHRPDHPLIARVDRRKLRQALVNLLINAVAAAEENAESGAPAVRVEVRGPADETMPDATLTISISDTGKGIPASLRTLAFEPFFSTRDNGTGLGLPGSRQIIERHGGKLLLDSPGRSSLNPDGAPHWTGATFVITLPLRATSESDPTSSSSS